MKIAFWNEDHVMKEAFHDDMGGYFELNTYDDILCLESELGEKVSIIMDIPAQINKDQLLAIMEGIGCTNYQELFDWDVQFVRLLAELNTVLSSDLLEIAAEQMDLQVDEVVEIIDRAIKKFTEINKEMANAQN